MLWNNKLLNWIELKWIQPLCFIILLYNVVHFHLVKINNKFQRKKVFAVTKNGIPNKRKCFLKDFIIILFCKNLATSSINGWLYCEIFWHCFCRKVFNILLNFSISYSGFSSPLVSLLCLSGQEMAPTGQRLF